MRDHPRAAWIPGLPSRGADSRAAFSTTLFFNALRLLLANRETEPLYELTSPSQPEPDGARIALHPGEGDTQGRPVSRGDSEDVEPVAVKRAGSPAWPWLVLAAAACCAIDQVMVAWRGRRWR